MDNKHKCKILLLYGSQTGTAQYAAEDLGRELERFNHNYELGPIDGFDPGYIEKQEYTIFVVSTTGYGEPPSNMKNFWNIIMAKDCPLKLNRLKYTIFGLGDSSYDRFNWVAKLLNNRLKMMGSELFHPVALGDDQHDFGYEGEFDPWVNSLINQLNDIFNQPGITPKDIPFVPKYKIKFLKDECLIKTSSFSKNMSLLDPSKTIFSGRITNSTLLTELERKVRSFEISVQEEITYSCGGIASLFLKNDPNTVDQMSKACGVNLKDFVAIELNSEYEQGSVNEYPGIISIDELFSHWLNINGKPSRYFCKIASQFTDDPIHKEKLELFASKSVEGKDEFYRYFGKEKITFVEFLHDFDSVKLPIHIVLSLIGRIPPREFSISSSNFDLQNSLELTVGLVENVTPLKRKRQGLCTSWLFKSSEEGRNEIIPFFIKQGTFPNITLDDPVLIIATGTGIAPIRNFIWSRYYSFKQSEETKIAPTVFFYGCRKREEDYFYGEENEIFQQEENFNFKIIPAFSREQKEKVYVYNKMRENSKIVKEMIIDKNCFIILVGSSKVLPKYMDITLTEILSKETGCKEEEIKKCLNQKKACNRYYIETW